MAASLAAARAFEHGPWFAWKLCQWSCAFIEDVTQLPYSIYGTWNQSVLDDEDLQQEVCTHLQAQGKYVSASDLQDYINQSNT
jgi:hypothetical protein